MLENWTNSHEANGILKRAFNDNLGLINIWNHKRKLVYQILAVQGIKLFSATLI